MGKNQPGPIARGHDQAPPITEPDEHAGKGGAYELVDGKRVLLERTAHPEQTKPASAAKAD